MAIMKLGAVSMSANKLGNKTHQTETMKSKHRYPAGLYIVLSIVIVTFVSAPFAYNSWVTSQQQMVQTLTFLLKSQDTFWFNGTGHIWFEDGSFEILTPWPAIPRYDSDDGAQIGWESWMPVERTFQEPEECHLEYSCVGLNMTVGPFVFMSNQALILYEDSYGRIIESTYGYVDT